jgi:LPXTG-motif cell wall-anchored protein
MRSRILPVPPAVPAAPHVPGGSGGGPRALPETGGSIHPALAPLGMVALLGGLLMITGIRREDQPLP